MKMVIILLLQVFFGVFFTIGLSGKNILFLNQMSFTQDLDQIGVQLVEGIVFG